MKLRLKGRGGGMGGGVVGRIIEPVIPKRPSETFRAGTRPRSLESFRF